MSQTIKGFYALTTATKRNSLMAADKINLATCFHLQAEGLFSYQ